ASCVAVVPGSVSPSGPGLALGAATPAGAGPPPAVPPLAAPDGPGEGDAPAGASGASAGLGSSRSQRVATIRLAGRTAVSSFESGRMSVVFVPTVGELLRS